jgi:hypothetical protein
MDKNIIKKQLSEKFLSEVKTPAISLNNKIRKDNAKINKDGVSAEAKDSIDYNNGLKQDKDTSKMAPNKFNYDQTEEKTYHDEMEIMNGQEMVQYDGEPDELFKKRALEAIEGSSNMGNNPEWANVVPKQQGFEGPDFGKNLVKKIKSSVKKRNEQTPTSKMFGDDWEATKSMGAKSRAIQENIDEMAAAAKPISDKNRMVLTNWVEKFGAKGAAEKIINAMSQTGMVSDFPDSMEYGQGLNKIEAYLLKQDFDNAFHKAKALATKLEKKAMKDMGMFENKNPLIGKTITVNAGKYQGGKGKIVDIPNVGNAVTAMMDDGKKAIITRSDFELVKEENNNNNNPQIKESMKRLRFKNEFKGLGNALKLIPEAYKVDSKVFEMTDGNETYKIRWEGGLSEGKAVILTAADKKLVNEDITRMKQLFGYKSQDTLGLVKGNARLDENKAFSDVWAKTRALMTESEDIESAKAGEGNWDEETKSAPEASKHIEGSTSTDKGTKAPKAKEGELDDAVSHAAEAKKHVEGSVSSEKGMNAPKPKEGHWEDAGVTQAADAKKHVHLKESEEEEEKEQNEGYDIMKEEPMDVTEMMDKMMKEAEKEEEPKKMTEEEEMMKEEEEMMKEEEEMMKEEEEEDEN